MKSKRILLSLLLVLLAFSLLVPLIPSPIQVYASPDTLTLRPNGAGTYQQFTPYKYENFSTFTESDTNGYWTQTTTRNTATNLPRSDDSYIWKDYGAGHFVNFTHKLNTMETAMNWATANPVAAIWVLCNTKGSIADVDSSAIEVAWVYNTLLLYNKITVIDTSVALSLNTMYYLNIQRSGTTMTVSIFSDSARTTSVDVITGTVSATDTRYLEVGASRDTTGATNLMSCYCEYLDLGEEANHYSLVSDQLDITGVQVTTSTAYKETETLADHTGETGTINSVTVYCRGITDGSTSDKFKFIIYNGTESDSGEVALTTSYTQYSMYYPQNPIISNHTWTWGEIDSLELGSTASTLASENTEQFSDYWIVVDYTIIVSGTITITSNPTGTGFVVVDGSPITTPHEFSWDVGSSHNITANSPANLVSGESQYLFTNWSDSGTRSHNYTVGADATVTATFQAQYYLTVTGGNSPSGQGWYNGGVTKTLTNTWLWEASGTSRTALTNWQLDTVDENPTRKNSGNLTTSTVTMSTYHTVNFPSSTQYLLSVVENQIDAGTFYIIDISDTQYLSERYPSEYTQLTNWIKTYSLTHNVEMVIHCGDIVNMGYVGCPWGNSTLYNCELQWSNANQSMSVLLDANIPYVFCAGNHDGISGTSLAENYIAFNNTFLSTKSYWVSSNNYGRNVAVEFTYQDYKFLVISLQFIADSSIVDWMKDLIETHPTYNVILASHIGNSSYAGYEQTWYQGMLSTLTAYPNVFLWVSGHYMPSGMGKPFFVTSNRTEIIFDRQESDGEHGSDSVRIYQFNMATRTISATTYNLYTSAWLTDSENQFSFVSHNIFGSVTTFSGSQTGDNWFDSGTDAEITASTPYTNGTTNRYVFTHWYWTQGGVAQTNSTDNPFLLTMNNYSSVSPYWSYDKIVLYDYEVTDDRCNIGTTQNINLLFQWLNDSSPVDSGWIVYINGIAKTVTDSWINLTDSSLSVLIKTWVITYANEGSNFVNDVTPEVTWDRINVYWWQTNQTHARVDWDIPVNIRVKLALDYDETLFSSGDTVYINGVLATWNSTGGYFEIIENYDHSIGYIYSITSATDGTYGITSLNNNATQPSVNWDRILVTFIPNKANPSVGELVTFTITLKYESDNTALTSYVYSIERNSTAYLMDFTYLQFADQKMSSGTYTYNFTTLTDITNGITGFVDPSNLNVVWGLPPISYASSSSFAFVFIIAILALAIALSKKD